jgi:DNA-directed RNA polymerase specialized sigma24 family protein
LAPSDGTTVAESTVLAFPSTHRSVVLAARSEDPEERARALEVIAAAYWRPIFKYIGMKWRSQGERAEDLTQGFFAAALEKGWLERFEPEKGRFRTFLLACLDSFVANDLRAAKRLKRGGGVVAVSLEGEDEDGAPREREIPDPKDLEAEFQREWARSLFAMAVESLRSRCRGTAKEPAFALFERYDLEGSEAPERPSYADLAKALDLPATQVTNHLHWARREFRARVLATLREITASEEEFRAEARALLGRDPP